MCAVVRLACSVFVLALLLPFTLPAQYLPDINTVALWHFDESSPSDIAIDASGNDNHGTPTGTYIAPGKFGLARGFVGNDFIAVPTYNPSGPFTLEAWISVDSTAIVAGMMYPVIDHGVYSQRGYLLTTYGHEGGRVSVTFASNDYSGTPVFWGGTDEVGKYLTNLSAFHHSAGTWDDEVARVYVDGSLWHEELGNNTLQIASHGDPIRIGHVYEPTNDYFRGIIDEVRISDKARTSSHEVDTTLFTYMGNHRGHSYYISKTAKTWLEARQDCEASGGHLATIGSEEENTFVSGLDSSEYLWIGLTDEQEEGIFVWVNGEPLTYTNWNPGEPTDYGDEDYVATNYQGFGNWNDYSNNRELRYVMEIDGKIVPTLTRMESGWNIISLPVIPADSNKNTLFPTATSEAFSYDVQYSPADYLQFGRGYWLRFGDAKVVEVSGTQVLQTEITVAAGWNLIGSMSEPTPTSTIESDPPGITTSRFFGYTRGYKPTDTIHPGQGYWVKVTQPGKLILSANATANTSTACIVIVPSDELPPSPPESNIEHRISNIPTEFALAQNHPNPFNPVTVIRYQLPVESRVTLSIYNVLGWKVATIIQEVQDAGSKSAEWDAGGNGSGVYFYLLEAVDVNDPTNRFVMTRKMLLMK